MCRKVAIIGAGQAGLQLALGLLSHNYNVTLITEQQSPENGRILSSQGMFNEALQHERALGIDFWKDKAPQNTSVTFTLGKLGQPEVALQWKGHLKKPFQSVDQRLKFSCWLRKVREFGGEVMIQTVTTDSLEQLAHSHDLTIVATGKGALSRLFKRDNKRSVHKVPPRILSCLYVDGMLPVLTNPGVRPTIIPGIGEYFTMPGLTLNGTCEMMLFEGLPGGSFDCWQDIQTPVQHLKKAKELLEQFVPWEAARCSNIELTDSNATLLGSYTPVIRTPIHKLPSGQCILGMGDAVILNDPIAGQGANNASKCANIYLRRILEQMDSAFNEIWMQDTFKEFLDDVQWSTALSNLLLSPEPQMIDLLVAASQKPELADFLANAFDNPRILFPWINSSNGVKKFITEINAGAPIP